MQSSNLAQRSVTSVKWNAISNVFQIFFGFLQTVLLARLLPIEIFGVFSGAAALTTLLGGFSGFGLGSAFTYRCQETKDIEQAAAVKFTLHASIIYLVGFFWWMVRFLNCQDLSTIETNFLCYSKWMSF